MQSLHIGNAPKAAGTPHHANRARVDLIAANPHPPPQAGHVFPAARCQTAGRGARNRRSAAVRQRDLGRSSYVGCLIGPFVRRSLRVVFQDRACGWSGGTSLIAGGQGAWTWIAECAKSTATERRRTRALGGLRPVRCGFGAAARLRRTAAAGARVSGARAVRPHPAGHRARARGLSPVDRSAPGGLEEPRPVRWRRGGDDAADPRQSRARPRRRTSAAATP